MAKMDVKLGSSKKRKRVERILRFDSFCKPGHPTHFDGSFQENMRALLEFGHHEVVAHEGLQCWSFLLELHHINRPVDLKLFVVEEMLAVSPHRQCRYCRSVGWGNHMICCKRFHVVLPSALEAEILTVEVNGMDSEKPTMRSKVRMELDSHLMHGILHLNGFGHLICVNGIEGGSEFISGHQIMDLWDRICTALHVRQVSLIDVARKEKMELRLIHGLAYGEPWFGRWGYKFGHGSFGITQEMHQRSLESLRGFPLSLLIPPLSHTMVDTDFASVVAKYQSVSACALLTLGDLFRCIMELKARLPRSVSPEALDFRRITAAAACRWSMKRVEMAANVVVEVLRRSEVRWVTRQEVRDAARAFIGDTGLLDYVLKSLGNHVVGNYIVRRMVNPVTKVLEYCLQNICTASTSWTHRPHSRFHITRQQLMKDLLHLHSHILLSTKDQHSSSAIIPVATNMLLDTKHLIKDYTHELPDPQRITLACGVRLRGPPCRDLAPREPMRFPASATVGDVKREVQRYCSGTYWGLRGFVADEVVLESGCCGGDEDGELVVGSVRSGGVVVVEGRVMDVNDGDHHHNCDYEEINGMECGGISNNGDDGEAVECVCGAREEDGERMVSCDICEVWLHARCAGVAEEVPSVFFCGRCESQIVALPLMQY